MGPGLPKLEFKARAAIPCTRMVPWYQHNIFARRPESPASWALGLASPQAYCAHLQEHLRREANKAEATVVGQVSHAHLLPCAALVQLEEHLCIGSSAAGSAGKAPEGLRGWRVTAWLTGGERCALCSHRCSACEPCWAHWGPWWHLK